MENNGIALICEGITDQVVIEALIRAAFRDTPLEDTPIRHLQPHRDATDSSKQAPDAHGGWKNVIDHLKQDEILVSTLSVNAALVIHVDGDICSDDEIDIDPNQDCTSVVEQIRALLKGNIDNSTLEHIEHRLIFAIPLQTTECWLLPVHTENQKLLGKKCNCYSNLSKVAAEKKIGLEKNHAIYSSLSQPLKRSKDLDKISKHSKSFCEFRNLLDTWKNRATPGAGTDLSPTSS